MATFVKDVLYPGRYRLADGRTVEYTRADVRHLAQRARDMVAAEVLPPAAWAHQDKAKPQTEEERRIAKEKWCLGHTVGADESPEGFLTFTLDVPSDEDAKRLPSVRFVSPEISEDFIDGTGRLWPGKSITHVAVTSRPVQHHQRPFKPARLSQGPVRLSLGDYEMAEEKDDKGKKKDGPPEEGGEGGSLKSLIEALRGAGLTIPDEVADIDGLIIAVKASGGEKPAEEPTETPPEPASPPVMMSLDDRAKATEAKLLKMERKGLQARITGLFKSGRISKPVHDKLTKEATTVRLSLDRQGDLAPTSILAKVEAYEDLPAGASFSVKERLSQGDVHVAEVPKELMGERPQTEADVDRAVDEWDAAMGRGKK